MVRNAVYFDCTYDKCYNAYMNTTEILIGIGIAILVIVLSLYLLSKLFKMLFAILAFIFKPVTWFFGLFSRSKESQPKPAKDKPIRYKSLADFAAVIATNPTAIDSNLHAIFTDLRDEIGSIYDETTDAFGKTLLAEPLASLEKIANAEIKDKSKPLVSSIFSLAMSIEDKEIKLDSALRSIFIEVYDYLELYTPNDATEGDYYELAYTVEKVVFPNDGPTEAQAEAASKRQAKIEAAIKAKLQ